MSRSRLLLGPLRAHPVAPAPGPASVWAGVWAIPGGLRLAYRLRGPGPLAVPDGPPGRRDGLWRQTCCEAFVAPPEGPGYREFNLAPGGHWQVYAFDRYRGPATTPDLPAPRIHATRGPAGLGLRADLPAAWLPGSGPWRLGLCVVLASPADQVSYWALAHGPGPAPDFHHPDSFAARLEYCP
jgi:hypothetical protein